ncbi:7049_t:CDS:2, partial [Dentiscutata erythropus]
DVEEPSGSTGIKEDFEPFSMQVEQENPSVAVIEISFKSYTFEFLLLWLNLSEGDVVTFVDPCLVHYSQASISNVFQTGNDLDNTIQDLLDGKVRMEDFPLINVCLMEDVFYSSDNRRLYCFKEVIKRGLDVNRIPVRIRRMSDINIGWKMEGVYQNFEEMIRINNNHNKQREKREAKEREEREKQRQYEREERQKEREEREKREAREHSEDEFVHPIYLVFNHIFDLYTFQRCLLVCKSWKKALDEHPFWRKVVEDCGLRIPKRHK